MLSRVTRVANKAAQLQRPVTMFVAPRAAALRTTSWIAPAAAAASAKPAAPLLFTARRPLHSSASRRAEGKKASPLDSLPSVDSAGLVRMSNEAIEKLQSASTHQLFQWTSYGLLGLAPVAIVLSPHLIAFPVDFALGLAIPAHMHIGLVGVIEDYVPRKSQGIARLVLAVIAVLTGIGLLKVNLCGAGITESVKSLWRRPKLTPEERQRYNENKKMLKQ